MGWKNKNCGWYNYVLYFSIKVLSLEEIVLKLIVKKVESETKIVASWSFVSI